jgi:two-component system response regulator YesN
MTYRVVILDDEELIREGIQLKYAFAENGFKIVHSGGNGRELLDKLVSGEEQTDIIFVDILMPIMGGLDFIATLKEQFAKVIVVILTGHDEFEFARRALRLDVTEYLLKPLNPSEMSAVMERIKEKLDERFALVNNDVQHPANGKEIIKQVLRVLGQEYAQKLTLKDCADRYYIHPNHLTRLFKQETGSTFNDTLTKIRMEKAKEHLLYSEKNVCEISMSVGYEDTRYFSNLFSKFYQFTPSAYRKRFQRC